MKKILIEIPDDHKRVIDNLVEDGKGYLLPHEVEDKMALAIRNGKVLSEMTNGEIIMTMFDCMVIEISNGKVYVEGIYFPFDEEWWSSPFKKEVEE